MIKVDMDKISNLIQEIEIYRMEGTMKYTFTINQVGICQAGLQSKTDLIDWAIIDYLKDWFFAEKRKTILNQEDGKQYTWLNYNHLLESNPLLTEREGKRLKKLDKHLIGIRLKRLKNLNLIKFFQTKDNTIYFSLTDFCVETCFFQTKKLKDNTTYVQNEHRAMSITDTAQVLDPPSSKVATSFAGAKEVSTPAKAGIDRISEKKEKEVSKTNQVFDLWCDKFEKKFGTKYTANFGANKKFCQILGKVYDIKVIEEFIDEFFRINPNENYLIKNRGYNLLTMQGILTLVQSIWKKNKDKEEQEKENRMLYE